MSTKVLVAETPYKREWVIREGDYMIFETEWLVDPVLDLNRSKQADFSRTNGLGEMVQVASIPTGLYWDWHKQGIIDDEAALKRRLNDSEFQHLRTNSLKV